MKPVSKRVVIVVLLALIALVITVIPVLAYEFTDGPETSTNAGFDNNCTAHYTEVHYVKTTSPLVFDVDRIHFGGRKPEPSDPTSTFEKWRRFETNYWDWNGSVWVLDTWISPADPWRTAGTCSGGLDYWYLNNDVSLDDGALVEQRLKFKYFSVILGKDIDANGTWHTHNLP